MSRRRWRGAPDVGSHIVKLAPKREAMELAASGTMEQRPLKRAPKVKPKRLLKNSNAISNSAHQNHHPTANNQNQQPLISSNKSTQATAKKQTNTMTIINKGATSTTASLNRKRDGNIYTCFGCNKLIRDRYLLSACDKYWHENCLKCDRCQAKLGELGATLYIKSNMHLCRQDYIEMFGQTAICSVCEKLIYASEMVMRAKQNVYHLECFACQLCAQRFCVGDRFYLCENKIVCQYDYEEHILPIQKSLMIEQQQQETASITERTVATNTKLLALDHQHQMGPLEYYPIEYQTANQQLYCMDKGPHQQQHQLADTIGHSSGALNELPANHTDQAAQVVQVAGEPDNQGGRDGAGEPRESREEPPIEEPK